MKKSVFIARIKTTRQEFDASLSGLDEVQMLQPDSCGKWSVKDVIAHVTWYEREMVGLLEAHALTGSDLWNLPLDQRNAAIHAENERRSLQEITTEAKVVHQRLVELLMDISEDDLTDASSYPGMPLDWTPWEVIASNTFEHYPDHLADIRKAFKR